MKVGEPLKGNRRNISLALTTERIILANPFCLCLTRHTEGRLTSLQGRSFKNSKEWEKHTYRQLHPVTFSAFRRSVIISVLYRLHILWMVSSPIQNPLLVCFVAIFIFYVHVCAHSYSNTLDMLVTLTLKSFTLESTFKIIKSNH